MPLSKNLGAEFIGTFWLVLGGCGAAVLATSNTSVNPARSTGVALFQGDWALSQLWLFWLAPIAGAMLAGFVYRWFETED